MKLMELVLFSWLSFVQVDKIFSANLDTDQSSFCASFVSISFVSAVIRTAICSVLFSLIYLYPWYHCNRALIDFPRNQW